MDWTTMSSKIYVEEIHDLKHISLLIEFSSVKHLGVTLTIIMDNEYI